MMANGSKVERQEGLYNEGTALITQKDQTMSRKLTTVLLVAIVILLAAAVVLLSVLVNQNNSQISLQQSTATAAAFATKQVAISNKCEREHPTRNDLGTLDFAPLVKCLKDSGFVLPTQEVSTP